MTEHNKYGGLYMKDKNYTPKWFSRELTGSGGKAGLLNEQITPLKDDKKSLKQLGTKNEYINIAKSQDRSQLNGTFSYVPFTPVNDIMLESGIELPDNAVTFNNVTHKYDISFYIEPVSIDILNIKNQEKAVSVNYRVMFMIDDHDDSEYYASSDNSKTNTLVYKTTNSNVKAAVIELLDVLKLDESNKNSVLPQIDEYLAGYSVSEEIAQSAEVYETRAYKDIMRYAEYLGNVSSNDTKHINNMKVVMRDLEYTQLPLEQYIDMLDAMERNISDDIVSEIANENLNLKLTKYLSGVNKEKANLNRTINPGNVTIDPMYSPEQRAAVLTDEPLAIIQAGAGTGKSTVILGRLKYMADCGINPSDIAVLSFTNAAADNITAKYPGVTSVTIASMINDMYAANFGNHTLSSVPTIMNSLDITKIDNVDIAVVNTFRNLLRNVSLGRAGAFKELSMYASKNIWAVLEILHAIKQTCLELQSLIVYNFLDDPNWIIPEQYQVKHMIVDEVQDNSIFEFIYILKSSQHFKQSVFIVGDCSQTLYEFREADPRALNVLEGSGVFATYKLQTNYRSNQEILDFANVTLADIEANKHARIQLNSHKSDGITVDTFQKKVKVVSTQVPSSRAITNSLQSDAMLNLHAYITDKFNKGEKVALLAYSRKHTEMMQEIFEEAYPNKNVVSIIPKRTYDSTVISTMIKYDWKSISLTDPKMVMRVLWTYVQNNILKYVNGNQNAKTPALAAVKDCLDSTQNNITHLYNWYAQQIGLGVNKQEMKNRFWDSVKATLMDYEIKSNSIRQSLTSKANEDSKAEVENADILLSTIHSAKGLEFDNVIVIHTQSGGGANEADKRMYYVAFTRAMKTELVWTFYADKESDMVNYHKACSDVLAERSARDAFAMSLVG